MAWHVAISSAAGYFVAGITGGSLPLSLGTTFGILICVTTALHFVHVRRAAAA